MEMSLRSDSRTTTQTRDHLFISYAWENAALTEWLALRLTSVGYRVWCDRFKLLGGEPWPADIDYAIKERTFRVLHLLSRHSINKPNPTKERELALALGRERQVPDFLIPLNVDGLKPADLPWRVSDLTFIPFERWDQGLSQLLKKLAAIGTPCPGAADGPRIAAAAFLPPNVLSKAPEPIATNCVRFTQVPEVIHRFLASRPIHAADADALADAWAFRQTSDRSALAFSAPRPGLRPHLDFKPEGGGLREHVPEFDGVATADLVSELLRKEVELHYLNRGFRRTSRRDALFIPPVLLNNDRFTFRSYTGRQTYVQAGGERAFGADRYRYRLAVSPIVRRDLLSQAFALVLRPRLRITDLNGHELAPDVAFVRRKQASRSLYNHEWFQRAIVLLRLLGEGQDLDARVANERVVVASEFVGGEVFPSINEGELIRLGMTGSDPPPESEDSDAENPEVPET